ncbi:bud emergence protein 1 [Fusarium solani]|nr:bud emergence protein 1 [Fusarium solani]
MIFTFGGEMLHSKPYRAVVPAAWKKLRLRQNDGPGDAPAVTHQDSHVPDIWQLRGLKSTVVTIVKWDFQAMRRDELECMKGQVLLPVAMPNGAYGDDWVVAKPIGSLGGNGLVPITYVSVISRSGKMYDSKNVMLRELREVGIPNVEEWKESTR